MFMSLLNDKCQRTRNISQKHEMSLTNILAVELFNVWGINFMGLFPPYFGNLYILVSIEYVSKWLEAITLPTNDAKVVVKFLQKNIFSRFGTLRAIISDEATYFCNRIFAAALAKYEIKHNIATVYHPQSNCQAEVSNGEIKRILEKVMNPLEKISHLDYMTHYRPVIQHTRHHFACLYIELSMVKLAIFH